MRIGCDGTSTVGEPTDTEEVAVIEWIPLARARDLVTRGQVLGSDHSSDCSSP